MAAKILSIALAVVLTACGGGGSESLAPTAPCAPLAQVRVQLFGDSTQEGYDGSDNLIHAGLNPTDALQAALDARYGRGKTIVTSRAAQGTTAQELLAGIDGRNMPWPQSVAAEIVVVNHGINDMTRYGGPRFAEYRAALQHLAVAPGAVVIFETPNITKGWDVAPYAQTMREVAAANRLTVADTYAYTVALPDWQVLIPDWAHPSGELYRRIAGDVLAPAVVAVADGMLCRQAASV